MPKKKDKKSTEKQDEKNKTSKKETFDTPRDVNVSDDREKELYLIQIRYLTEQLERYQQRCDQLEKEKKDFSSVHLSLEKEKRDIVDYLKHSLLEKEDEVDELTERLEIQRQTADKDRETVELQNTQLREELHNRMKEVTAENVSLAAKLDSLSEFQRLKEEMESNMESLEKQLKSQEEEHKAAIHNLEIKVLLEKNKLEKEMEVHVAAIAANVQCQVEQKIPETTKTALQENLELKAQLDKLSLQTQALMEENSALLNRNRMFSVDVENLEQMLKEISRQSCILKRTVEQITEKSHQLQAELKKSSEDVEQLQRDNTGLLTEMETLRQDKKSSTEQCNKNRADVSRLEAELQEEKRKRSRMQSIMQEAVGMLGETLMLEACTEEDLKVNQCRQLMQRLLLVLGRSNKSTTDDDQKNEQQTSHSAEAREVTLNPDESFQFELARHRLADLGIVPRLTNKRRISSSLGVALHRRPLSQKKVVSFNPADSAFTKSKQKQLD